MPDLPPGVLIHPTACVDSPASIGEGTRIWHFSHVMAGAIIGRNCTLGQNVFVASGARIGSGVKIQNNVSVYDGVELEDDVFCGPSCVFTNVKNPRAFLSRRNAFVPTRIRRGATLGANATVVCGSDLGRYAMLGAGAVVSGRFPDYALLLGVPARRVGWVSRAGHRLTERNSAGEWLCPETGERYREEGEALMEAGSENSPARSSGALRHDQ